MKLIPLAIAFLALPAWLFAQSAPQLSTHSNEEVIAAMTTEEKARLLVGTGVSLSEVMEIFQGKKAPDTDVRVLGAAGETAAIPRLGIPSLVLADGPAGLRIAPQRPGSNKTYYATAFPIASLQAATWDEEILQRVGKAMGQEATAYGVDIILAPGMNIQRNALGGRNFEYYSEDPLLTGKMAAAMIRGVQSNRIGTSVKHFAANNHETNRFGMNVKASPRALREIYLRGFEIAVQEAQPWTVMSSYNKINGTYTSQREDLLRDVLRDDWGFRGFVMTDWYGGQDPIAQMQAGNNLLMPGTPEQYEALLKAVEKGKLSEAVLDKNVADILNIIRRCRSFAGKPPSNEAELKANANIARQAAMEGMVLLRNTNQALPLRKGTRAAVFGNRSYELISGGTGSGDVNEAYTVSLIEGMKGNTLFSDEELRRLYSEYLKTERAKLPKNELFFLPQQQIPEMAMPEEDITAAAERTDVAILTIGRISGEFEDRKMGEDFYLTDTEKTMLERISRAFHEQGKKVVVVLNVGGPVDVASWRNQVDAILLSWLPGQEAGYAISSLLTGGVSPCGKLPMTFPKRFEDDPTSVGFPGKAYGEPVDMGFTQYQNAEIDYDEGVFTGYRAFDKAAIEPAYEFGYGISYTVFGYSSLKVRRDTVENKIRVGVTITNEGGYPARETAQLYLSAPGKSMPKPVQELKGFAKTPLLQPGQSKSLVFSLDLKDLASFDEERSAWVAEAGTYTLRVGASSRDIRLEETFKLPLERVVEQASRVLSR